MKLTSIAGSIAAISLVAFCFGASFLIPTDAIQLSSRQELPSLSIEWSDIRNQINPKASFL